MTHYLILGAVLAVAAAGIWLRRRSSFLGQMMILAGCVGCIACLGWQIRQSLFPPAAREPDRGQAVVAYTLANQVLGETGIVEGRILLFFPPSRVMDEDTVGTYAGTFKRVLRGFPGLDVQVVGLEVPKKAAGMGQIPLAAFRQVASNFPSAVACVSFAGVPADIQSFSSGNGRPAPPFFVFDPWSSTNWLAGIKSGVVRCVIVPRPGTHPAPAQAISGEPGEIFERLYLMATRSNADEVAAKLAGKQAKLGPPHSIWIVSRTMAMRSTRVMGDSSR
jgi:hypothetical protein